MRDGAITHGGISSRRFRDVLGHWPTGVAIISATDNRGERRAMTVGSFASVSLVPPLVSFFAATSSTTFPFIRDSGGFCVNILGADQHDLCARFARSGGDKFAGLSWNRTRSGSPVLDHAIAWVDCTINSTTEVGDHYVVVGEVVDLDDVRHDSPLVFYRGGYGQFLPLECSE